MILSILIPTLNNRKTKLDRLIQSIDNQLTDDNFKLVEILVYPDNGEITTGQKRNELLERAKGEYVVFVDDDDEIPNYYVEEILNASSYNPDSMAITGTMIQNKKVWTWDIRQSNPYDQIGNHFRRYTNHITPIKRKLAIQIKFPDKKIGEDFEWATKLKDSGLLKTEYTIDKPMYIYKPSR